MALAAHPLQNAVKSESGKGKGITQINNGLKSRLTTDMYPGSGRILISQRSFASSGNSATAFLALRAVMPRGSSTVNILEPEAGTPGMRLKIGRLLSVRGITLYRWKFVMTAAAVSPFLARCTSASVTTSSLAWCAGGNTSQSHFAGLSRSTLLVKAGSLLPKLRR